MRRRDIDNAYVSLSLVILRQEEREKSTATNIIHKSNTIIRFQFSDVITMASYSFKTKMMENDVKRKTVVANYWFAIYFIYLHMKIFENSAQIIIFSILFDRMLTQD